MKFAREFIVTLAIGAIPFSLAFGAKTLLDLNRPAPQVPASLTEAAISDACWDKVRADVEAGRWRGQNFSEYYENMKNAHEFYMIAARCN